MKRLAAAAAAALTALTLASCGSSGEPQEAPAPTVVEDMPGAKLVADYNDDWTVWELTIEGRKITCVVWLAYYKGGPTCDFAPLHVPIPSA